MKREKRIGERHAVPQKNVHHHQMSSRNPKKKKIIKNIERGQWQKKNEPQ